ncbi:MAG: hypothetical protein IPG75_19320 [Gemmatimonadetes bacterium]|nr:hypothetical protein [Gemmatimonadota bacterium]
MNDEALRGAYAALLAERGSDPARTACPGTEALQRAVAIKGPEADRLAAVNHAMACPPCRREFELLRALQHAVPSERVLPAWLGLAAAALLVVAVGLAVPRWWRGRADVVRGPGGLTLLAPAAGATVPAPVDLVWSRVPGAARYEVLVLGHAGDTLLRQRTTDTIAALPDGLPAGAPLLWHVTAVRGPADSVRSDPASFTLAPR